MTRRGFKELTRTRAGFLGAFGGLWEQIPQPPKYFSTSVQVCGYYPFGVGTGRPTNGAPLGQDMFTGAAVCTDHDALFRRRTITSPSALLLGLNGFGKSTTAQTLIGGQVGRGLVPAVFDPIKGEHVPWVRSLGGTVFTIGPHAHHRLNPVSPGPLGYAARQIGGTVGAELQQLARAKAATLVKLLVRISREQEGVKDYELTAIQAIVDTVLDQAGSTGIPVAADLLTAFQAPSLRMLQDTGTMDAAEFHAEYKRLGQTLRALLTGEMGQMLSGRDSVEFTPGNPGGFCFDTSGIDEFDTQLLSAAMLSTWSLGMDAIDAHWELAQHEQRLHNEAAAAGERYEPAVTWRGYTTLMDEFWFPMRACEGMVDLVDKLSRTNRSVGTAELKVTHSPKDFLSLPNEHDREKAKGFIERAGLLMTMALSRTDLEALSNVRQLTPREIDLVASFNQEQDWDGPRDIRGRQAPPPGAGKVLLKISERVGIPVRMLQTATQRRLHNTSERFD